MSIIDREYMRERRLRLPSSRSIPQKLLLLVFVLIAGIIIAWLQHRPVPTQAPSQVAQPPHPIVLTLPPPSVPVRTDSRLLTPPPERASSPTAPYATYLDQIEVPSTALRTLVFEKIRLCPAGDHTCAAVRLYQYVQQDLGYLSDPVARNYIQSPKETLTIGAGDCEDLSILLASLLENAGLHTYLVFTKTHVYTLACDVDPQRLPAAMQEAYTPAASEQVAHETRWVRAHTTLTMPLPILKTTVVRYTLTARDPIDWAVVPTSADAQAAQNHQPYRSYTCSRTSATYLDDSCTVDRGAQALIVNPSDSDVQVSFDLRYPMPATSLALPTNATTYSLSGQQCLVLDPAIKGAGFPGETMPIARTAAERIAVDRAGNLVRLAAPSS